MTASGRLLYLAAAAFLAAAGPAAGAGTDYLEDFSSRQYMDSLATTPYWDTVRGELRLHDYQLSLVGNYNTAGYAMNLAIDGDRIRHTGWRRVGDAANLRCGRAAGAHVGGRCAVRRTQECGLGRPR
jgi:hypothetical protein